MNTASDASVNAVPGAPLRLAVVGTGVIGRHHARVAAGHPGLEPAALIDAVPEAAAAAADEVETLTGARPVTAATLEDALAATGIDVVAICAPSGLHVDLAAAALAAGKHVVIEKPLDTTMPRARHIAGLARDARGRGLVTSVISQHRFDPASVVVAAAVRAGRFGAVTSGLASVPWYRSQAYYDGGDWRGTWRLDGGGVVMNQGIHTVDLLVWLLGRPVEITASVARVAHERIEVEDVAAATLRFASGALGVIHCTTAAYPGLATRLQVHATRGSAVIDGTELAYFHAAPGAAVLGSAATTSGASAPDGAQDQKAEMVPPEHLAGGPGEPDPFLQGHVRQYDDIVAAIREGRAPGVTVEDALLSLAVVRGLYISASTGAPVRIEDVIAGRHDETEVAVTATRLTAPR